MPTLTLACPAKVNLFLKVVRRRPDGYHDLVSVMQPLTLADELILSLTGEVVHLDCDHPTLPRDDANLAVRAARLFQQEVGRPFGVHLRLTKNIPLAAGLGGGSSDAAGVLRGLNDLTGRPLPTAVLHRLGAHLGADVPFFLESGPALAQGIGDRLTPLPLPPHWFVLINPGFPVDTGWVYRNLRLDGDRLSEDNLLAVVRAAVQKPEELSWLANDLESVTLTRHPDLAAWKTNLLQQGARAALMSGSGPTIFGVFADVATAAQAAAVISRREAVWVTVTRGLTGAPTPECTQETHP